MEIEAIGAIETRRLRHDSTLTLPFLASTCDLVPAASLLISGMGPGRIGVIFIFYFRVFTVQWRKASFLELLKSIHDAAA